MPEPLPTLEPTTTEDFTALALSTLQAQVADPILNLARAQVYALLAIAARES